MRELAQRTGIFHPHSKTSDRKNQKSKLQHPTDREDKEKKR